MTPEQSALYAKLTDLQKHTANASLAGASNGEAHEIACSILGREPAKNARIAGHEALTNPNTAAFLESVLGPIQAERGAEAEDAADAAIASREEILEFFTDIMREPALTTRGDLIERIESGTLTRGQSRAFAGFKPTKYGTEIKQHSQTDAAKQLVEMQGYKVAPKAAVDKDGNPVGTASVTVVIDADQYAERRAEMLDADDC